jgi:hypothetical protein
MEEYFGAVPLSNSSVLCVGGITNAETTQAQAAGLTVDGYGYYLYLASAADPKQPIEILGKLLSNGAAEKLARMLNVKVAA